MKTNNTATAKYGYVITTTPGLIEEGTFALEADALARGEIKHAIPGQSSAAVFRTAEEAEAAMLALVPDGSTPAVYAGLHVEAAWDVCPDAVLYGWTVGQNGYEVPSAKL